MNALSRRGFLTASASIAASMWLSRINWAQSTTAPSTAPAMFTGRLEILPLTDDIHVIFNGGGNTTVCAAGDELLVIDSGMAFRGAEILARANEFSPNAQRKTLFNTHWHLDHAGGNPNFAASNFTIVASTTCRQRLSEKITIEDFAMTVDPLPESARPTITFDQSMNLFGHSHASILKFPPAHTDTDAIAIFDKQGVLVTGDLFFAGVWPIIDRTTGGSLDGYISATKSLLEIAGTMKIVPGHGPIADKSVLQGQFDLMQTVHDRLSPFGEKKTPLADVMAQRPLADLDDKWGRGYFRSEQVTKMYYGQWLTR